MGYSKDSGTLGWKLYENSKYNFSFQYPSHWIIKVNDSTGGISPFLDIHLRNKPSSDDYTKCTPGFAALEIQVGHQKSSDQSFESFVNSLVSAQGRGLNPGGKLEKIIINGSTAFKVEHSGGDTLCKSPGYFIEQNDSSKYTYILTAIDEQNGVLVENQTIEQIVNSINF